MADPIVLVDAPTRPPRRGGIKSIIGSFQRVDRLGAAANVQYLSEGCAFPSLAPGLCWGVQVPGDKSTDGIDVTNGIATIFGQYAGVECFLEVGSERDYARRAEAVLERGEHSEIEAVLSTWASGGTDVGTGDIIEAVALADQYADQSYIGLPVIMMNRANAVRAAAAGAIEGNREGDSWTINGTPILASWVVPETDVYVIGWPTVYVSETTTTQTQHLVTNREMAIAERLYGVTVDCLFRGVATVGTP